MDRQLHRGALRPANLRRNLDRRLVGIEPGDQGCDRYVIHRDDLVVLAQAGLQRRRVLDRPVDIGLAIGDTDVGTDAFERPLHMVIGLGRQVGLLVDGVFVAQGSEHPLDRAADHALAIERRTLIELAFHQVPDLPKDAELIAHLRRDGLVGRTPRTEQRRHAAADRDAVADERRAHPAGHKPEDQQCAGDRAIFQGLESPDHAVLLEQIVLACATIPDRPSRRGSPMQRRSAPSPRGACAAPASLLSYHSGAPFQTRWR